MLPPGAMTLMAAEPGAAHPFPLFDVFPQRFLLQFTHRPQLGDDWCTVTTVDGHQVQVRAADCGAACRCAGEFRMARDAS